MPPRFKRNQQASSTSSSAPASGGKVSGRSRFKRSSLHSQPSTRRRTSHSQYSHSQREWHHSLSQSSTARQSHPQLPPQNADDLGSEEAGHQVVMAIDRRQKQAIGCAYYVASEEKLYCIQDVAGGNLDALETEMEIQPTLVLLSTRVDSDSNGSETAGYLRRSSLIGDGEEYPLPYQVDIRPSQEFAYEAAKAKLLDIETIVPSNEITTFLIPGAASTAEDQLDHENFGSTHRQGKLLRLSSYIDFESSVGVGCMGAIMTHLQRKRLSEYLPEDPYARGAFCVRSLEMVSLRNTMFINPDTLLSLQIIQPESHPNAFNQGPGSTGSKESLSLYGLFHHYARTPQGKVKLRQIFLRPSLVPSDIRDRHDLLDVFVLPNNLISLENLSKSLGKIKNIRTVMTHLHKGINGGNQRFGGFKSGVWPTLLEFAYHTIDIRDALREINGGRHLPLVAKALDLLDVRLLQNVGTNIHDIVDLDSSIEQNRTSVKRGVNSQLDHIKNIYDGMDDLLSRTAFEIARTLPDNIATSLNVIYFPQLGYHITLPIDPLTRQPIYQGGSEEDLSGGGRWERMFVTENQVYFKDARMREMDEMLGDLWNMICDLEIEISYDLAQRILEHEGTLVAISDLCGELDCMFALALGAVQYKLVRPRISEENVIDIKDCRHLLQEMTIPSYVTNDAYLVGGSGPDDSSEPSQRRPSVFSPNDPPPSPGTSMVLLTGPNYSGKSIYLKSIAHVVYLSQIGSFVPCSGTHVPTIGLTDAILTRIRTCETVSRSHSAFMIDLQQVAQALRIATRRSLIVIDEFGKGTECADGAGLAAGLFHHLLGRGGGEGGISIEAPKVLAATHFHEIFEMGYLTSHPQLAFAHMEVRLDPKQRRQMGYFPSGDEEGELDCHSPGSSPHSSEPNVSITYLYTMRPGRCTQSFGTQCAGLNGIPRAVVQRASLLSDLALRGEDLVRVCAGLGRGEEEDLRNAEEVARRFLQWDISEGDDADVDDGDSDVEMAGGESNSKEDPRKVVEKLFAQIKEEDAISDDDDDSNGSGSMTTSGNGTRTKSGTTRLESEIMNGIKTESRTQTDVSVL